MFHFQWEEKFDTCSFLRKAIQHFHGIKMLKKILESRLDCKESKPAQPKGNQCWIFTDAEAEAPVVWPPDAKSRLIRKDTDPGKDWRQKKKRVTEDEMVGWHDPLSGHELGQTLGDGEGQGSLVCCSPLSCKESGMAWWLNSNSVHWQPVHHGTHEGVSWDRQWVKDQKLNQNPHFPSLPSTYPPPSFAHLFDILLLMMSSLRFNSL